MAEDIQLWSPTAANNGAADPAINWAEGQARASVNNSARSMMAAHAKDRNLKNGSIVTSGTTNAQTFLSGLSYTVVPTGLEVLLKIGPGLTSVAGTNATLNMDGIGAVGIKTQRGDDVKTGLVAGAYAHFLYNGTNWIWLDLGINTTSIFITQVIVTEVADGGTPVAFLDFTGLDTTLFRRYQLVCTNVKPEIDATSLCFSVSTDNGATFPIDGDDYNSAEVYHYQGAGAPGTVAAGSWSQDSQAYLSISWTIDTTWGDGKQFPVSVVLDLYNFEADISPAYCWFSMHYHTVSSGATMINGAGYNVEKTGANAIRIWLTEGNFLTGKFALYGVPI